MRKKLDPNLEAHRVQPPGFERITSGPNGAFALMGPTGSSLRILASSGDDPRAEGFEHVSVSLSHRAPNWQEMCFVKSLFWEDEEIVYQLHPPKSQYVNNHPNVLHLWRKIDQDPPMPPSILVGIKDDGVYGSKAAALAGYDRAVAKGLIKE